MNHNPHTLNQILVRIREQMRCPQCGTKVQVDFPSIKLAGDSFLLLQLKCGSCNAFIVLHVNLTDATNATIPPDAKQAMLNSSSSLTLDENEMKTLRNALEHAGGSFEKLFEQMKK